MHTLGLRRRLAVLIAVILSIGLIPAGPAAAFPGSTAAVDPDRPVPSLLGDDMVNPEELVGNPDGPEQRRLDTRFGVPVEGYQQANHTIDVAVVRPSGSSGSAAAIDTDAEVKTLVTNMGEYWKAQTNSLVASLTLNSAIKWYKSGYECSDLFQIWDEAATKFGQRYAGDYVSTGSRHLLVLVPDDCGGTGVGTVGSFAAPVSVANGGAIWASLSGRNDVEIVAHEFGHNLGLRHSNIHFCPAATMTEGLLNASTGAFSDGCADREYMDAYDVMGATVSVTVNGTRYTNARPTALNVTHKDRLGVLIGGEVQPVSLPAGTLTQETPANLASTGETSGLRALKLTDPRTGQIYFVDFRGGGRTDAGSLYETGYLGPYGTDIGVRVLTTRAAGDSIVLLSPDADALDGRKLYLNAGESLSTQSGGITVTVRGVSTSTASVTVRLNKTRATTRLSGPDRYSTAVALSKAGYPGTAPVVYLATGTNYPDALAAAPAAALKGGPLLLTDPATLSSAVKAEIQRLTPQRIVVVGGVKAVSTTVFNQVKALAPTVSRLSGADRYETARMVVADAFGPVTDAYVATALNYPDALAAAAAAGAQKRPVLLVNGAGSVIDSSNLTLMEKLGITKVAIVGGTAVVSRGLEQSLKNAGIAVTRQGGSDRFVTSQLVNQAAFSKVTNMYLATAYQFPDALAGAALAGARNAPLYIVPPNCMPNGVLTDISRLGVGLVTLIGGVNALNSSVAALTRC